MKIIIVNGYPGSGKTEFQNICNKLMKPYCFNRSSIDMVKEIAKICGWTGEKTPKDRKFLSDLKDLLTEYNDLPFNDIKKWVRIYNDELVMFNVENVPSIMFCDVREPKEIERLKNELGAITVFIMRENHELKISNHADADVENYKYDYYIDNNGTLEDLENTAIKFLNLIFK